jgi:immunoglobulin-like protein involved in spore germination
MVHFELVAGRTPPPPLGRQFTVSGLARTFEANVAWRVKEGTRTVAEGHATASEGTSAVWGTFSTQVTLPASVRGQVTLELFEASARDGTPVDLVAVPLVID